MGSSSSSILLLSDFFLEKIFFQKRLGRLRDVCYTDVDGTSIDEFTAPWIEGFFQELDTLGRHAGAAEPEQSYTRQPFLEGPRQSGTVKIPRRLPDRNEDGR